MNLVRKTLSGFTFLFTGQLIQAILQIGILMVLARIIDKESFGLLSAAMIVTSFASIFATVGVGPSLIQSTHPTSVHFSTGLLFSVALGFCLSFLLFFLSGPLGIFLNSEKLSQVLRILCWVFPIEAMGVIAQSWMRRNLEFTKIAVIEVSSALGYGLVGISLAVYGFQIWALVWAVFIQSVLRNLLFFLHGPRPFVLRYDGAVLKSMLFFGGGVTLSRIATYCATQVDKVIVGKALGIVPLGIYGRAIALTTTFAKFFGQTLTRVLFPVFSQVQADTRLLYSAFGKGLQSIALLTMPVCMLNVICGKEMIQVLLGPRWTEAVLPFQIVSLGLFFRTAIKVGDSITLATGAVYRKAWRQYVYLVSVFLFSIIGSLWGLPGVACGTSLAWFLNFLLISDLSLRLIGMKQTTFWGLMIRPAMVTGVCGVLILVLTVFLRSCGYPALVIILGALLVTVLYFSIFICSGLSQLLFGSTARWFQDHFYHMLQSLFLLFYKKDEAKK